MKMFFYGILPVVSLVVLIGTSCAQLGLTPPVTIDEICTPVGATAAETDLCKIDVRLDYLAANTDAVLTWANTMAKNGRLSKDSVGKFIKAGEGISSLINVAEAALEEGRPTDALGALNSIQSILATLVAERAKYGS